MNVKNLFCVCDCHRDRLSRYEEVDSPPKFSMRLRDRNVAVNSMVRLTCQVQGSPPPTVRWHKDGFELRPSGESLNYLIVYYNETQMTIPCKAGTDLKLPSNCPNAQGKLWI